MDKRPPLSRAALPEHRNEISCNAPKCKEITSAKRLNQSSHQYNSEDINRKTIIKFDIFNKDFLLRVPYSISSFDDYYEDDTLHNNIPGKKLFTWVVSRRFPLMHFLMKLRSRVNANRSQ